MKSNVIAAVALAVCAMGLGAPAGLAQEDGSTQPTSTTSPAPETTSPEEEPTGEPEPTTEPEDPSGEVTLAINPTAARPGQTITATATCDDSDEAILRSEVLGAVILTRDPEGHQPWALRGTTKVSEDARPGDYDVYAKCDASVASTTITVLSSRSGGGEDGNGGGKDDGQVPRTPRGAPETGGGPDGIDPLAALLAAGGLAGLAATGLAVTGLAVTGIAGRRATRR